MKVNSVPFSINRSLSCFEGHKKRAHRLSKAFAPLQSVHLVQLKLAKSRFVSP